jgi:hypothetical protein
MTSRFRIIAVMVVAAITLMSAASCSFSVGVGDVETTRISWPDLKDVLLSDEDLPEYLTKTDEGVMQSERLHSPGREGVDTGYGILFEIEPAEDVPAVPLELVLSEAELYEDSEAAAEAVRVRPGLIVQDAPKSGLQVTANEVQLSAIGEQAGAARLDMVTLNDVQYTILFRQGRILGSVLLVASKDYGEDELLQTGEEFARLMADRMQVLLEKKSD